MESNFADGLFYYEPRDNAPDFVLASINIRPDIFTEWLNAQKTDNGFVRLQALRSKKTGKPYVTLDTYKKTQENAPQQASEGVDEEINPDDIPF